MTVEVIQVISPGILSLIQDSGRRGYQKFGVSVGGAMDAEALLLGNRLVGNTPDAAVIEVTLGGAEFAFPQETVIAVTGGNLGAQLGGVPVPEWESFRVPAGSRLAFSGPIEGLRAYLCVAGGIASRPVLGARSTHTGSGLGGLDGGPLKPNAELPVGQTSGEPGLQRVPASLRPQSTRHTALRVVPGPQEDAFTIAGVDAFYGGEYTVTDRSDRQGVRLDGPQVEAVDGRYDIVSDAVVFGSVQVPGDGKPIVLLADRQTTGGYAKIGVVASVDLPALAQAAPGSTVSFTRTTVDEAQADARERMRQLLETPLEDASPALIYSLNVSGQMHRIQLARPAAGSARQTLQMDVDGSSELVAVEILDG